MFPGSKINGNNEIVQMRMINNTFFTILVDVQPFNLKIVNIKEIIILNLPNCWL